MSASDATALSGLSNASQRCSIYLHESTIDRGSVLSGYPRVKRRWAESQYATELWVKRALLRSPLRVDNASAADLIFIATNYSMWCEVGRVRAAHGLLQEALRQHLGSISSRAKFGSIFQFFACLPPEHKQMVALLETVDAPKRQEHHSVSPYVVSRPDWLVGLSMPPQRLRAWSERPLLFMAGHMPKLYISPTSPTRYRIWKQVRNEPNVTMLSSTINCTIGSFRACASPEATRALKWPANGSMSEDAARRFFTTFCRGACTSMYAHHTSCAAGAGSSTREMQRVFEANCRTYRSVDFSLEYDDMQRDTRRLSHDEYLAHAMAHRFCLVAPGDSASTHKIAESIALGGAGGCVPVFVVGGGCSTDAARRVLPYTRWLDYCELGYFITVEAARADMLGALRHLRAISADEWHAKSARLRAVRDAFVFRANSSLARPSAAEFLLHEMCSLQRANATSSTAGSGSARWGLSRCGYGCPSSRRPRTRRKAKAEPNPNERKGLRGDGG